MSPYEKRLCNALQNGLPIVQRPFARIAETLQSDEKTVIGATRRLLKSGVIRRLGAVVNWRAIGKTSTLVTAHIEQGDLEKVVKEVNSLEGVSHNYLREHYFNLWFALRADSNVEIDAILGDLSKQFDYEFYSLPVMRIFKLDVRFDAESEGRRLITRRTEDRRRMTGDNKTGFPVARPKKQLLGNREDGRRIVEIDRGILEGLQKGLKAVERPFDFLCKNGLTIDEVLSRIEKMIGRGVIHRIGAVVNHHKLGFTANAMFVCKAEEARAIKVGEKLAKLDIVSHCYERRPIRQAHGRPFEGWPYNIFGMMHSKDLAEIRATAEGFVKAQKIVQWEMLETTEEFKKGNS